MGGTRRKVTRAEANVLVAEWRASGKAMPAWCAARGIDGRSLRHWANARGRDAELRVVEMTPATSAASAASSIRLRVEGVTIVVTPGVCETTLARVLRAVRAC
jgi:hypothetical protein